MLFPVWDVAPGAVIVGDRWWTRAGALTCGHQSFLRLRHVDSENGRVLLRTFSPYLDAYNLEHQQFEMSCADLGIIARPKVLATDALTVDVLTDHTIAAFDDVPSGSTVSGWWYDRPDGTYSWYVVTSDPYGAVHHSPVSTFTVDQPGRGAAKPDKPKSPKEPKKGKPSSPGKPDRPGRA